MSERRIPRWVVIIIAGMLLVYLGSIVYFEARLGYFQPQGSTSLVIATFNDDNDRHERVLRLERIDGQNYIAVNHWPRAWYHQALDNPEVEVKMPGEESFAPYLAVPIGGEEEQRVAEQYPVSFNFRFRTGLKIGAITGNPPPAVDTAGARDEHPVQIRDRRTGHADTSTLYTGCNCYRFRFLCPGVKGPIL